MTVEAFTLSKGKGRIYTVLSDSGKQVARFSTLEEAALVARFLSNGAMPDYDYQRAMEAIREYDRANKPEE